MVKEPAKVIYPILAGKLRVSTDYADYTDSELKSDVE